MGSITAFPITTKKISELTTLTTGQVDQAADFLEITDTSASSSKKVTPLSLFNLSGTPLGTTDTQNVQNKTLDNTNTVTLKDTLFTLQDDGDTSKQARFQLSGLTTATTRVYTLQDNNDTLVGRATTDTLTNKTLTSPTINSGTIDNTTITVDAISGHTTANTGTVYGVAITAGLVTGAGVITSAAIAALSVTAAKMQFGMVYRRQGGTTGAASWATAGTTSSDTSAVAVFRQVGSILTSAGADVTVTFPVAFSQIPVVFLSTNNSTSNANPIGGTISTTTFVVRAIDSGGAQRAENVVWEAVGQ